MSYEADVRRLSAFDSCEGGLRRKPNRGGHAVRHLASGNRKTSRRALSITGSALSITVMTSALTTTPSALTVTASALIGAKRAEPAAYFARRFAAKEACLKALGSGITKRVGWHDVEVLNGPKGQPMLRLRGGALRRLKRLIPKGHGPALHVSLADDPPMALAFVIIEARLET
jgi:holo-[acyl-carrier protein] synthase